MSGKHLTVTEQLMAKRLAKKPFSQQTPGDVLEEAIRQVMPQRFTNHDVEDNSMVMIRVGDLEQIARVFLGKVMASG